MTVGLGVLLAGLPVGDAAGVLGRTTGSSTGPPPTGSEDGGVGGSPRSSWPEPANANPLHNDPITMTNTSSAAAADA